MALEHLSEAHSPFWFEEASRRVANGMALLDERGPDGWRPRMNIVALDMGHPTRDVLGQLYGTFHRGMIALFGESWATRIPEVDEITQRPYTWFGFEPVSQITRFMLTDAWRKALWTP
jgi:hypothetical protein